MVIKRLLKFPPYPASASALPAKQNEHKPQMVTPPSSNTAGSRATMMTCTTLLSQAIICSGTAVSRKLAESYFINN